MYLDVPFEEKNEAKSCGAIWDSYKKKWFCKKEQAEGFRKWLPNEEPLVANETERDM